MKLIKFQNLFFPPKVINMFKRNKIQSLEYRFSNIILNKETIDWILWCIECFYKWIKVNRYVCFVHADPTSFARFSYTTPKRIGKLCKRFLIS